MSTQDAHRIGPQQALQSYLDDLLLEATPDRPAQPEAFARPQPAAAVAAAATPAPERAAAPARPMAHEPQVLEPRPLVLPTIKLTDIKLVGTPVDEAAASIRTALAEPTPAPAPVVNEPAPVSVSVAVSIMMPSAEEAAAPVAEREPFPVVESPAPVALAAPEIAAPLIPTAPLPARQPIEVAAAPIEEIPAPVEVAPMPAAPLARPVSREPAAPPAPKVLMPSVLTSAPVVETPRAEPLAPAAAPPLPPKVVSGRPEWGEQRFECLLFDVAGLTLAVPLVCLGTIHSLEGQTLTPLFGQPDWFLGMLKTHTGNIKVIDTARWVMPERYRDEFRDNLSFVITIQGFDWGLAVHKVDRSIHLHPDQIKWRSLRTQRPWLAGTVIEHMCALLDVAALAELIESGALKRAH